MVRRVVALAVTAGTAIALVVFVWPRLFGLEHTAVIAQVVALRGLAALCAVIVAVLVGAAAFGVRRFRQLGSALAALLLVFAAANAVIIGIRGVTPSVVGSAGSSHAATGHPEGEITVLAWNTLGGAPTPGTVARLALSEGADVVAPPETTMNFAVTVARLMKAGGRSMWVHAASFDSEYKAKQTSLLTSTRLGSTRLTNPRATRGSCPLSSSGPSTA